MPAYQCSMCNINIPSMPQHNKCPVCGGEVTWHTNATPDPDWKEKVDAGLRAKDEYDMFTPWPIPDAKNVTVAEHNGQLWVPHTELVLGGYRNLTDFDIVLIDGTYYELQGRVGRYSNKVPGGMWWVEEVGAI